MLVIGLGHKARNGKDTVAKTIIEQRGDKYDVRRYAFADALKIEVRETVETMMQQHGYTAADAMRQLCRDADDHCQWQSLDFRVPFDPNPDMSDPLCPYGKQRPLLQWWGTEYRRAQDPQYWIKKTEERLNKEKPQVALITDMRMRNEFWWVRDKMRGLTVKVSRTGFIDFTVDSTHQSETDLLGVKFDYEIEVADNNLQELKDNAVKLFDMIVDSMTPPSDFTLATLEREAESAAHDPALDLFNRMVEANGTELTA